MSWRIDATTSWPRHLHTHWKASSFQHCYLLCDLVSRPSFYSCSTYMQWPTKFPLNMTFSNDRILLLKKPQLCHGLPSVIKPTSQAYSLVSFSESTFSFGWFAPWSLPHSISIFTLGPTSRSQPTRYSNLPNFVQQKFMFFLYLHTLFYTTFSNVQFTCSSIMICNWFHCFWWMSFISRSWHTP